MEFIKKQKTCDKCSYSEEVEIVLIGGKEISEGYQCDNCQQQEEKDLVESNRIAKCKIQYERVVPAKYRETDIEDKRFNRAGWEQVKQWKPESGWIGLVGVTGLSKTRMLNLLVKRLINLGYTVEWALATKIRWASQNKFDDEYKKQARENLHRWERSEILVIDDFGKNKWSPVVQEDFFDLIEYRYSRNLTTLWSANTDPKEMIESGMLLADVGEPLIGRLTECSQMYYL